MVHGYNTRGEEQEPVMNNQDQMKSMKDNLVNKINSLKDEIINFKEIVIRKMASLSDQHKSV